MLIGYARVSTDDQVTRLQVDALKRAGVRRVFWERGSGVGPRPELHRAIGAMAAGDVLVVWKLDRLARSLQDLLRLLEVVADRGGSFRSLTEPVDTSTSMGRLVLQILGAVAEFERSLIRERSIAGQVAALERGVVWGGRPPLLGPEDQREARRCYASGWWSVAQLAEVFGVSRSTMQRVLGIAPMSRTQPKRPVLGPLLRAPAE